MCFPRKGTVWVEIRMRVKYNYLLYTVNSVGLRARGSAGSI